MPRLTRIYTRTGDEGETNLGSGRRVPKDALRIAAYGDVDELNSSIGVALAMGLDAKVDAILRRVQNELFNLGSDLCFAEDEKQGLKLPQVEQRHIDALEAAIDDVNETVGALANFILPGGAPGSALLHVARCVCRRAERSLVALRHHEKTGPFTLAYLNRLSDFLFVAARYENKAKGRADVCWDSHA